MHELVFLFDVDNTLLDNDHIQQDLRTYLEQHYGEKARDRYWALFEEQRAQLGYADYLGALQRYRVEDLHDPRVLRIANWLADYPFAARLYPFSLDVVRHAQQWGTTVILSDGDAAFQPRKVERSGLWRTFGDNVLIFVHKEESLDDVERLFPARHYVMVDDKLWILQALKEHWGDRVTTVFPRQGHYALEQGVEEKYRKPDIVLARIGDLLGMERTAFAGS
ncbi:MAG TPA: HAD family hydrolase [Acetobacteraceae bacterium]|nr:HAD family hydrolase [Acetobacteraceae bacterium]